MTECGYTEEELSDIYDEAWSLGYNDEQFENPYLEGTLPWKQWEEGYEDGWNNG